MTGPQTVRACPIHHCRLDDELVCRIGRGQHTCTQWLVVDVKTRMALVLVSADGDETAINRPLTEVAKLPSLAETKGASMPKTEPTKGKTTTTLKSARFKTGQQVLLLQLHHRHDIKDDSARFRVRWAIRGPKGSPSGVVHASASESDARAAFEAELAKIRAAGQWKPALSNSGKLQLRPVPAPEPVPARERSR